MKKQLFILFLLVGLVSSYSQKTWNLDKTHSNVKFAVKHMVISTVEGYFRDFDATLHTKADGSIEKFDAVIKVASINTDNEKRDSHLKSDDFFAADKYPDMTFVSNKVVKKGKSNYKVSGDLTMRGTTKPITLDIVGYGTIKDNKGNTRSGYTATGNLDRFDYGLKWNAATETGGLVVSRKVAITINTEFVSKPDTSSK